MRKRQFMKDVLFLCATSLLFLVYILTGQITMIMAIFFLVLYAVYSSSGETMVDISRSRSR